MNAFALGIIAVFVSLVILIFWLFHGKRRRSTIPGLKPSSDENGNINDISKAGSLHEFLMDLHMEFGPIASFWWGTQYTVSISSPDLFRQHQHLFDRPELLFRMFEPFWSSKSITYANGKDGKSRRQAYDKVFNYDSLCMYYDKLQGVASEMVSKWEHAQTEDQFPLAENMIVFSIKCFLIALMGDTFKDDKEASAFKRSYDVAWDHMEQTLVNPTQAKDDAREQRFQRAMATLKAIVARAVKERENRGQDSRDFLLIDAIIALSDGDADKCFSDAITYSVAALHTTGYTLTWCIYYMCMHEEVQEKLYQEIIDVLGPADPVSVQSIGKLKYLRQVLDETLRCAVVAPWAARYCEEDMELGGYTVPAGVPMIQALGVSMKDEKIWPHPTVFDPDRFSEQKSKGRPSMAFSPFGFAGKRMCPGYRFSYMESTILLVTTLQKFKFLLVPGQDVKPEHGLVTHPKEEIWFKVVTRQ